MRTQLYQVLPGRPYGRARHGTNVSLSADPHTRRTATGTIGTNTLNLNAPGYADGDVIKIHQTINPASETEENYELAVIVSGGGTSTLTLQDNLGRTYTAGTQVCDVREYRNLTIVSHAMTAWNGSTGAMYALADAGRTSGGVINGAGKDGFATTSDNSGAGGNVNTWRAIQSGGGFVGGWNSADGNHSGAGEGIFGSFVTETSTPQGNGGAGTNSGRGGGGGNETAGGGGTRGGSAVGNVALTSAFPGGGGGGANAPGQDGPGCGGNGGSMYDGWHKFWDQAGVNLNGGNGGNTTNPPFGGGGDSDGSGAAGGSGRINCERGNFGTNLITADKGICPFTSVNDGAYGRIRINYGLQEPTGTTFPAASTAFDAFLVDPVGGAALFF